MYSERDEYYKKSKKPDQNFYHSKQQQQQQSSSTKRYEARQISESRTGNYSSNNHQQDRTPKMTLPPTGQRINTAAFKNLPMNIDSLPPRLKRKYLKDAGLPEELADKPIMEIQQQFAYSLPYVNHQGGGSGGTSHNRYNQQQRYDQYHQNSNFQSKYNNNNQNHHHHTYHSQNERNTSHHRSRSITPTRPPLSTQSHQKHSMIRNDWKSTNNQQQQKQQQQLVEVTSPKCEQETSSFDWSEDVLNNSNSLPHDVNTSTSIKLDDRSHNSKFDDQNHRQRNRRRRNRRLENFGVLVDLFKF